MIGQLNHLPAHRARRRADELLGRFDLSQAADRGVKTYSGGMRRRLDLAAGLMGRPQVLFLDEPTTGLDPRSRLVMWDVVRALVADGTTVLLTTQYLDEADQLADRVGCGRPRPCCRQRYARRAEGTLRWRKRGAHPGERFGPRRGPRRARPLRRQRARDRSRWAQSRRLASKDARPALACDRDRPRRCWGRLGRPRGLSCLPRRRLLGPHRPWASTEATGSSPNEVAVL